MIFRPMLIEQILAGRKTVTRRPMVDGRPPRYRAGMVYGIQPGMARASVARIRVLAVTGQHLGAITDQDAVLEGFPDRAAFVDYWLRLYGAWDEQAPVWRIEFCVVEVLAVLCAACEGAGIDPVAPEYRAEMLEAVHAR